jgi:hypothetical protein
MARLIPAGQAAIITWVESTINLVGSAFDQTGTDVFFFNELGAVGAFRAGRNPALNNLAQVEQWFAYQVNAGSTNLSLPDSTLGFGNAPGENN